MTTPEPLSTARLYELCAQAKMAGDGVVKISAQELWALVDMAKDLNELRKLIPVPASLPILRVAMDDSNVVPLKAVEKTEHGIVRELWVCHCDCFSFRLFDTGDVQCAQCGVWADGVKAHFGT